MSKSGAQEAKMDRLVEQFNKEQAAIEISLSDILNTEEYKERCGDGSCGQEVLEEFLWLMGLDTQVSYDQQYLPHRNMRGEVVTCARWVGKKRTDQEWKDFIRKNVEKYQNG